MAQQKFKVKVSKKYNPSERVALSAEIIDEIIKRTQDGKDKKGNAFSGKASEYSESYKNSLEFKVAGKNKNAKPNLTLSGEMLNALTLLSHKPGEITIGIPKDDEFNNAKAEGNIKGTYGQSKPIRGKKRDFMGISRSDLKTITEKYPTSKGRETNLDLLQTLLATEASRQIAEQFLDIERLEDDLGDNQE